MLKFLLITLCTLSMTSILGAETYYWVGGTGNWSDTTHWAASSGGNDFLGTLPTVDDDVVFDQNSFFNVGQTVSIDVAAASCRNMTWANAQNIPTLNNPSAASLTIHGDLTLKPQMVFGFTGVVVFRGAGGHNVQSFNHVLGSNVYFDDADGEWNVLSPLRLTNILFIRKGEVALQNILECRYLNIMPTALEDNCSLVTNSNITLTGNNTTSGGSAFETMKVNADFANLDFAPGSIIELTGTYVSVRIQGIGTNYQLPIINFSNNVGTQILQADGGTNHEVNNLSFGSNGYIYNSTIINELTLSGSKTYRFGVGQDIQISTLNAVGSCNAPIYLFSTSIGARARMSTPATVFGSFLNIRDIEITSGDFQVTDAKDLGNTAGWNLTDIGSQTLYWVGGAGSWQDQNHWSYTSGGIGGACIPTPIDDVVFDLNSFTGIGEVVTLDGELSYCRNMSWDAVVGVPTFDTNGRVINISGSLDLDPDMNVNITSIIRFDAFGGAHTITSEGHNLGTDVRLETIGGSYTLNDDLNVNGRLLHVYGGLLAGGNTINLVQYYSNYGTARTLDISNADFNITGIPGRGAGWDMNSNGLTFIANNSSINAITGISLVNRGGGTLQFDRVNFSSTGNIYSYNGVDTRFQYVGMPVGSFVFANNQFDTLVLAPSQTYEFSSGSVQSIGRLIARGTCEAAINLKAQTVGMEAIFFTDLDDSEISYTQVKDIHVQGGGQMENIFGVDNGNTAGWVIPSDIGRDLYWVGDGGSWNETAHWSLTSGGPGGECVPTSVDNVYFDSNSFTVGGQIMTGGNIYFKNMSWDGATNNPAVSISDAYAYGSVELIENMTVNYWGWIRLAGNDFNRILDTRGKAFVHLEMNALGNWTMASPINTKGQFYIYNGGLATGGHDIRTERFRIWERMKLDIDLSSSVINLFGDGSSVPQFAQYQSGAAVLNFEPGTSTINIEHANGYTLVGTNKVSLHNLNFISETGRGYMDVASADPISYHKVTFSSDGLMLRQHVIDSLIFASGKTYTLHSGVTQVVNDHLEIMGSPCAPTILNATSIGVPATIMKVNGDVTADYITMRDQIGAGANFNAGQHSTNVANSNAGWIFETVSDDNPDRGLLGADQILCDDTSITLQPYPFENDLIYNWNDGDNNNTKEISNTGLYWADVTFDGSCTVRDTILLINQIYSNTTLGNDTTLCAGSILELNVALDSAEYLWHDASTDSLFTIMGSGKYYVEVMYEGCPNADTINVDYNPIPEPRLGVDRMLCKDEVIDLSVGESYASILWNDISPNDLFQVTEPDTIWVDITEGGCTGRDSIIINYFDIENYLGPDTSLCAGDILNLLYTDDGISNLEWNDGSTGSRLVVDDAGTYSLKLTRGQCELIDTIEVSTRPQPTLFLDREMSICEGDVVQINPISNGESFVWSNEANSQAINVSEEGTYQVTAVLNGCSRSDYITIFIDERPTIDLGADTTICVQNPMYINLSVPGGSFEWNDGSTLFNKTISSSGYHRVLVTRGACEVESDINVIVEDCKEFAVFAPNIFSPDGDGSNDEFVPEFDRSLEVTNYMMTIYNRWGGIVFQTTDIDQGWDGTANGKALQRGNYIYTMVFSYVDELKADRAEVNGDVFLAR